MHNVTVDDNDASITYQPPGSWVLSVFDSLDAGGQHHVTSDPDATASFTFTGWFFFSFSHRNEIPLSSHLFFFFFSPFR